MRCRLKGSSPSTDQLDEKHYQRQHQQNVDIGSNCVKADQTDEPKYQENYKDRPQHGVVPFKCDSLLTERYGAPRGIRVAVQSKIRAKLPSMNIAIQGEPGSFSHEAALKFAPEATILP